MENKWGRSLWLVAVLALGLVACKHRGTAQDFRRAIEKADTIWACKVDGYPVKDAEQQKGLRYVCGYEVKNVHPLLGAEVAAVKAALIDSLTFDTAVVKSCPMVAQYAIAVRQGGKMPWALVLSTAPCGKALLFDRHHADKPTAMELRTGNKLEPLVTSFW